MQNPFKVHRVGGVSPYVWYGMRFGTWAKLLARGRFDITVNCVPRMMAVTGMTALNSGLAVASGLSHGRRLRQTEVQSPVFIIGHWRTGTTLLHELLDCDPRFHAPNTYQCMFPSTFLLTQELVGRWTSGMLPKTRPFDNMEFGPDKPQEDEFALLNSGAGTPYRTLAFPRHGAAGLDYMDISSLPEKERDAWEATYRLILQRFQTGHDRCLVLKSPVHAARIRTLLKLYPDARFIFTARDPFDVFVSHVRTVKVLAANQGLHNPIPSDDGWVKDYVLDVFEKLFEIYERDRDLVPPGQLIETRYEDLVGNPQARLESLYDALDLGDFAPAREGVAAYLNARKNYKRNVNTLAPEDRERVGDRFDRYRERFGYGEVLA